MTAYTNIKADQQHDSRIPELAVQAFRQAFETAQASAAVVYVHGHNIVQALPQGGSVILKDVSDAYVAVDAIPDSLKRRKKTEVTV